MVLQNFNKKYTPWRTKMRLRNIKGSKEFIASNPFVIQQPTEEKGEWKNLFKNDNPIHIEVGMGKGQFIHQLASDNPNINYIGIEKFSSVLYRALEKRAETNLDNLFFLRLDAEILCEVFEKEEISRIYLNFSDPWPKDRHSKRRLTSPTFLGCYDQFLAPDGELIFKTDNRDLFDFSVISVKETKPWKIKDVTYDLHHSEYLEGNIMTEYENRFVSLGNPIHRFVAYR